MFAYLVQEADLGQPLGDLVGDDLLDNLGTLLGALGVGGGLLTRYNII